MGRDIVRRTLIVLLGIAATLAIGVADYLSPPDVLLSLLYLAVIVPVAWWAGRSAAVIVAFVAAGVWTIAQILTSPAALEVDAWNAFTRGIIFIGGGLIVAALRSEQQRLRSVDRQREEFLTFMAHELRQPVAAIDVAASAVAGSPGLSPTERRVLVGLRSQARRLTGLAEDLLSIGRLEGGIAVRPAAVDLCEVAASVAHDCEEPSRIAVDSSSCPILVRGDAFRIGQALDNLVSNALKYSPRDTTVRIRVAANDGIGRVEVRDDGIGVAPGDLPKLFQKYGRLESTAHTGVQGAGLGLYLVRLIAESHGGHVRASSAGSERGSVFTLELPVSA